MLLMILIFLKIMIMYALIDDYQVMKCDVAKVWKSRPSEPLMLEAAFKLCHLYYLCNADDDWLECYWVKRRNVKFSERQCSKLVSHITHCSMSSKERSSSSIGKMVIRIKASERSDMQQLTKMP